MNGIAWQDFPLLRGLDEAAIAAFVALGEARRFAPGEVLLQQGTRLETLYLIREGLVAVRLTIEKETLRTVVHLGPGQVLGEISLVDQGPHSATAIAEQPTHALAIPHQAFWAFCEQHPQTGLRLLRNLAADLAFKLRHANLNLV